MNKFYHKGPEKKKLVTKLFNDIANSYDFLNHFFSFGVDYYWRHRLIKEMNVNQNQSILDVATGTGDVVLKLSPICKKVTGIDIASNMIDLAKIKQSRKNLSNVNFLVGDAEKLPFDDSSFDLITISYGYRNISNPEKALKEFNRILKNNGKLFILEFSEPTNKFISPFYKFYSYKIMPFIASCFTKKYAYDYLPESIDMFPSRDKTKKTLEKLNFSNIKIIDMTFGISSIFVGKKHE
ncbi:MAG: bifunctional demethylmenaquinone methyltransferase/2-methoxy-6-polyprenyl-1,4-benzoquinol methylase [Pelagibacteraceae bacterium TMED237]|nr:bifunctional demethylmenaquinone methyltransferase/2-methoxy-6-polyprenyl-1,4-benzoquinol methylase UbiE [Candidatus Neomarinimicrobiota bacterium]OUW96659.1 MAG: bifunctional demethylmenaquinone methyltransferase/2-methoxy-6-polyprenyl-1,4-benzoquinol methylase [Pelagibacteraceae bacterium TMED237]|tara:strand:+ start:5422 stop:6135 length:714 start_codon:yes stop_codon:yes gene_type:complete